MKKLIFLSLAFMVSCQMHVQREPFSKRRALHLIHVETDQQCQELAALLPEFASWGINTLILEINYNFQFPSHPELVQGEGISAAQAKAFAMACKASGIELIPQFQCLGHQSWAKETFPLLTQYPELDLTPNLFPENEGIYCREWDPTQERVWEICEALIFDLISAFQPQRFHVGLDEVFLLGHKDSTTAGQDPAKLFADSVKRLHQIVVEKHGLEMWMWSDRLWDAKTHGWGDWEADSLGMSKALHNIPKDIVLMPWHYEVMPDYPSLDLFIEAGFQIMPTSWRDPKATRLLIEASQKHWGNPAYLGHCFSTWGSVKPKALKDFEALQKGLKRL